MILSCPFALPIALLGNDTCKIRERRGKKKVWYAELQITKQIVIDSLLKLDKNKQADHLCGSVT